MAEPTAVGDGLREWLAHLRLRVAASPDDRAMVRACESPAERILLFALLPLIDDPAVGVRQQVEVGPYRLDFAVEGVRRVAVEVDGHEWHEKTQEQAARDRKRDRYLLARGWPVMRFTAVEVARDPHGCCAEVEAYATALEDVA